MSKELVVLTEEPTGKILFTALAAKLRFDGKLTVLTHAGIGELRKSVQPKIASHPNGDAKFLIVLDQDNSDCAKRKQEFAELIPARQRQNVRIRIACREVESWLIAQPAALGEAGVLNRNFSNALKKRNPDDLIDPKQELQRHLHSPGQMALMRKFAPHIDINNTKSRSFANTISALRWAMT